MAESTSEYLDDEAIARYRRDGFLRVDAIVKPDEVDRLIGLLEPLFSGQVDVGDQRIDLGDFGVAKTAGERIIQVMLPSDFVPELHDSPYFERTLAATRQLLGDDMARDMEMLMDKPPHSDTETPWHQDAAYWLPEMPDRRALSVWLALDRATVDNGCMWYVPGSHNETTRKHRWAGPRSSTLATDVAPGEGVAIPLEPGDCVFHDGNMLHFTRGNTTDLRRRALIVNYRPSSMIDWERERGFDHRTESDRGGDLAGQATA
jgi:phytanoyl-CoA hydroxylase